MIRRKKIQAKPKLFVKPTTENDPTATGNATTLNSSAITPTINVVESQLQPTPPDVSSSSSSLATSICEPQLSDLHHVPTSIESNLTNSSNAVLWNAGTEQSSLLTINYVSDLGKENNQQLCQRQIIYVDHNQFVENSSLDLHPEKLNDISAELGNESSTTPIQIEVQVQESPDPNEYIALQPVSSLLEPFYRVAESEFRSLDDPHSLDCLPTPMISPFKPLPSDSVRAQQVQNSQLNQVARAISSQIQDSVPKSMPDDLVQFLGNNNIDENNNVDTVAQHLMDEIVPIVESVLAVTAVRNNKKVSNDVNRQETKSKKRRKKDSSDKTAPIDRTKKMKKKKTLNDDGSNSTNKRRRQSPPPIESVDDVGNTRKRHRRWNKYAVVDKNKLTMFDLISYNPPPKSDSDLSNTAAAIDMDSQVAGLGDHGLSSTTLNGIIGDFTATDAMPVLTTSNNDVSPNTNIQTDPANNDTNKGDETNEANEEEEETEGVDVRDQADNEESSLVGPRVRVNEKGELVLDERSLIVKRKKNTSKVKTVFEDEKSISSMTNYSSFKRNGKQLEKKSRWTDSETVKFYTALTIIGTDFTLMAELFFRNKRSRLDLKNKFKNEEKYHKVLIDNALKGSDLSSLNNIQMLSELGLSDDEDHPDEANEESNQVQRQAQVSGTARITTPT